MLRLPQQLAALMRFWRPLRLWLAGLAMAGLGVAGHGLVQAVQSARNAARASATT